MSQQMSIDEIEAAFQSEWVLVEDYDTDEHHEVVRGKVLHHSKDRDEVYRKAAALKPHRFAMIYTGEIPEGTAVVL